MIPYEEILPLLPHEYSYALYLSYGFDLCMYDPMILNMVSKRYPRDEDYASDSDSDMITDEDFDFDVPPWLFQDLEDEDGSLIQKEHDHLNIVFGSFDSFDQDSDLETIAVAAPLISIEPELDEFSIKIGEISCPVASVKQSDDEGENVAAPNLDSGTTKEIETGCEFGISDCSNNTVDPDPANQLQKHTTCSEIVPSTSIFVNDSATRLGANVIFNASKPAKPQTKMRYDASSFSDPELKDEKKLEKIVTDESNFCNLGSEIVNLSKSVFVVSKSVLATPPDPVCTSLTESAVLTPDSIRLLANTVQSRKELVTNSVDQILLLLQRFGFVIDLVFNFGDPLHQASSLPYTAVRRSDFISVSVWFDFIFEAPDRSVSFVGDGNKAASMERRRKKEVSKTKPQPWLPKPPDPSPPELPCSFCLSSLWLGIVTVREISTKVPWSFIKDGDGAAIITRNRPNLVLQPRLKVLETVEFKGKCYWTCCLGSR